LENIFCAVWGCRLWWHPICCWNDCLKKRELDCLLESWVVLEWVW
jgi:hypothetical protein